MVIVRRWLTATLTLSILASVQARAAEMIDDSIVARMKEESIQRSQVANTISIPSDIHGPRLRVAIPLVTLLCRMHRARLWRWWNTFCIM